jgi:hypothetical protein
MALIQESAPLAFDGWGSFFFKPMTASFSVEGAFGMKTNFGRV